MKKFKVYGIDENPETNRFDAWELRMNASDEKEARERAISNRYLSGRTMVSVTHVQEVSR